MKKLIIIIILNLVSCKSNNTFFVTEYLPNPKETKEKLESIKKLDSTLINKTIFSIEHLTEGAKTFSLIESSSNINLFEKGIDKYLYYQNSNYYIIELNRNEEYTLKIENEKFLFDKKTLKKYVFITLTYDYKMKKYHLKFSNKKRGYY